jgi:hypothetical protein
MNMFVEIYYHLIRLLLFQKEYDWPIEKKHYDWLKVVKRSRKKLREGFSLFQINNCSIEPFFFFLDREEEVKVFFFSFYSLSLSLSFSLFSIKRCKIYRRRSQYYSSKQQSATTTREANIVSIYL